MRRTFVLFVSIFLFSNISMRAQGVDEDQLGAWYMYFWNTDFKDSEWGIQGDFQYRDWQVLGDREQLLLRSGVTYAPKNSGIKFTLGYANISTGVFGTDIDDPVVENRIYQEGLFSNTILKRVFLTHRFRYEQRWVEDQDFRTRYRYNLFANVPINKLSLEKAAFYGAFYNEMFINGQRDIGDGRSVQFFDRNRTYFGLGYVIKKNLRTQLGWMRQTSNAISKAQLQFSVHHSF